MKEKQQLNIEIWHSARGADDLYIINRINNFKNFKTMKKEFMELNAQEIENVNGGMLKLPIGPADVLFALACDIIQNWESSKKHFREGMAYNWNHY